MSFGQQSGPPASNKQIQQLAELLNNDGFSFATARHRYGLTQRQARGNFTVVEAAELIERLTNEAEAGQVESGATAAEPRFDAPKAVRPKQNIEAPRASQLRGIPAEVLADELERRGWAVIPPS